MKNLIKAQLYQLRRKKFTGFVFLFVLLLILINLWADGNFGEGITASEYLAVDGFFVLLFSLIFIIHYTGEVCAADFMDKTANYEVMGGYTRADVYVSRVFLSLAGGCVGAILLWAIPVIVAVVLWGWGNTLVFSDMLCRYLVALFCVMRLICEFVFLSCLVKNSYIILAIGAFISFAGGTYISVAAQISAGVLGQHASVLLSLTNLFELFNLESFRTYSLVNLKSHIIYDASLAMGDAALSLGASLGIGVFFLWLGYSYFCRDDFS
ncbi:MAG: hypothetical protein NC081_01975 [Roseburia sp.]|nr:hypothetical protein [Roseburia sp.]